MTDIASHCAELDRCNQRGGRMMSIFDLIEAGSLDVELAAWLMSRVSRGDSLMVGARPGGAGKTTVMCALVNLIPADMPIVAATSEAIRSAQSNEERTCYLCHEIGAGPYFCYLWGAELRAYCALARRGHLLATNLHSDDIAEARDQVCGDNGVPAENFNAFRLLIFLRVGRGAFSARRVIEKVYKSDGAGPHALVFDRSTGLDVACVSRRELACRQFIEEGLANGARTTDRARRCFLEDDSLR